MVGISFSIVPFRFRTIFFCSAAARAAPPPFVRVSLTGEVGLDDEPKLLTPSTSIGTISRNSPHVGKI